ncbi:hypothetical protein ACLOJK_017318 [Asimina triloba]
MASSTRVQNVTKASSDELLRKFADLDSDADRISSRNPEKNGRKRRKGTRAVAADLDRPESPNRNSSLVEWKSLLPPANRRRSALLQRLSRPVLLRSRDIFVSRSLMAKMEKVRGIPFTSLHDDSTEIGVLGLCKWACWASFSNVRNWAFSKLGVDGRYVSHLGRLLPGYRVNRYVEDDFVEEILEHGPSMV